MNYTECNSCLGGDHDECEKAWLEGLSVEYGCDCEECYPLDPPKEQKALGYFESRWMKRQ